MNFNRKCLTHFQSLKVVFRPDLNKDSPDFYTFTNIHLLLDNQVMTNFDDWNNEKKRLNAGNEGSFYLKERQIWIAKMGLNVGNEVNGKGQFTRPVLVLSKIGNMYFVIPLTSVARADPRYYFPLQGNSYVSSRFQTPDSVAILSQVRTIDKRRFKRKIGSANLQEYGELKKKLKACLL